MKIAILFTGRVKGYDVVIDQLKKMKEHYSADFYVSCGSYEDTYKAFVKEFEIPESNCFFNPVPIPKEFNSLNKAAETKLENCSSMFYHNKMAFDLVKKSNKKYDVILKYRADIDLGCDLKFITFQECVNELENMTIYIPKGNDFGGVNDQIAYGTEESMERYCKTWDNIILICKDGHRFHPETLLFRNLEREKITIARFNYKWSLVQARR
jgi:hypothetical protein